MFYLKETQSVDAPADDPLLLLRECAINDRGKARVGNPGPPFLTVGPEIETTSLHLEPEKTGPRGVPLIVCTDRTDGLRLDGLGSRAHSRFVVKGMVDLRSSERVHTLGYKPNPKNTEITGFLEFAVHGVANEIASLADRLRIQLRDVRTDIPMLIISRCTLFHAQVIPALQNIPFPSQQSRDGVDIPWLDIELHELIDRVRDAIDGRFYYIMGDSEPAATATADDRIHGTRDEAPSVTMP